jgi:hypothetical protein
MPDITVTVETTPPPTLNVFTALLPTQTGNAGKLLTTNGSTASWTSTPTLQQLNIEGSLYPFWQIKNNSAPVDKKYSRLAHDGAGSVNLERVNDGYTAVTAILAKWDVSNNTTLSGNLTVGGTIQNVFNVFGPSNSSAYTIVAGSSQPNTANCGAFIQLYGGTQPTFPGRLFFGSGLTTHSGFDPAGNLGIGTTSPQARLHVVGGDALIENNRKISMPDASGSSPALICQSDNNFVFYGTKPDGTPKAIFSCFMRSSTLEPLQFSAPVKIGGNGGAIGSIVTAGFYHQPGAIAANGGSQFLDVTLTGADSNTVCFVECNGGMNVNAIILKANVISGNVVRVYWINPTPSSVSLAGANYRVCAVTFI